MADEIRQSFILERLGCLVNPNLTRSPVRPSGGAPSYVTSHRFIWSLRSYLDKECSCPHSGFPWSMGREMFLSFASASLLPILTQVYIGTSKYILPLPNMTTSLIISCVALVVAMANLLFPIKEWMQHWFPWLSPQHDQNEVRHPTITVELVQSVLDDQASPIRAALENFITGVVRGEQNLNAGPLLQPGTAHTAGSSSRADA